MRKNSIKKNFYLSPRDDKKLKDKCLELNINESQFFRNCINDKEVDYSLRKDILNILYELRKIGNNINQIAYVANRSGYVEQRKYENNYNELLNIINNIRESLR